MIVPIELWSSAESTTSAKSDQIRRTAAAALRHGLNDVRLTQASRRNRSDEEWSKNLDQHRGSNRKPPRGQTTGSRRLSGLIDKAERSSAPFASKIGGVSGIGRDSGGDAGELQHDLTQSWLRRQTAVEPCGPERPAAPRTVKRPTWWNANAPGSNSGARQAKPGGLGRGKTGESIAGVIPIGPMWLQCDFDASGGKATR
jgi:hypothetical protein